MPSTTAPQDPNSVLPSGEFQANPTLKYTWAFVLRTKYTLSELDNIAAGRAVQYPEQIPAYQPTSNGAPQPAKARELMREVFSRSQMADLMAMMGLAPVEFGDQIKNGSKAVMTAFGVLL
ncbi:hypothetical protein B0H63DRAFT_526177 [Podospora didyma]|uniref:Uncharacterized protein n=1 Tax=Podospora didyma TaxID=330526 RepID=A0AAE0KF72_9PEZI|nr:hypothetical protein B0H63DRAFT_526177 [Podospora didyma]